MDRGAHKLCAPHLKPQSHLRKTGNCRQTQTMKRTKPEVAFGISAITAIQNALHRKLPNIRFDGPKNSFIGTTGTDEADE